MDSRLRSFACWTLMALTLHACQGEVQDPILPRTFQPGKALEAIRPMLLQDCDDIDVIVYSAEMAAPFKEQVQVNCSGLDAFGDHRKAEFMFNDGPLGHIWVHIRSEEMQHLSTALSKNFGKVVYKTDLYTVFASGTVALRSGPPEVLIATPELISAITGYEHGKDYD